VSSTWRIPLEGVGNFRLSAMRQRGTYAAVIRYITIRIPVAFKPESAHRSWLTWSWKSAVCC
jgi:Tfp pilus assembly ATPase PilU